MVTESCLENNFTAWCKEKEIVPIKGPTATSKGFPDRFLQLPNGGGTIYIEFKGTGYYDLTPLQQWWRDYIIKSSPNRYFKIDNKEDLEKLKQRCLDFISIGTKLVEYETELLNNIKIV
jgi:hypothetical protein